MPPGRPATTREQSVPLRTCVGCGRNAPKQQLVRFTEVDGMLIPAPVSSGRGAYTCRSAECFALALERRAFARALRRPVVIEPELARLYTEESYG